MLNSCEPVGIIQVNFVVICPVHLCLSHSFTRSILSGIEDINKINSVPNFTLFPFHKNHFQTIVASMPTTMAINTAAKIALSITTEFPCKAYAKRGAWFAWHVAYELDNFQIVHVFL